MSSAAGDICSRPEEHQLHICQLKKKGLSAELAGRTDKPGYICHNCNAVANRGEDLCNASPFVSR